jgi:homoserine O-succinyltransferase/O-acetyltransferase
MAQHCDDDPIVIGLVNNMPDGALKTTERQFKELLSAAAGNIAVRVRLFSLPEARRAQATRAYIDEHYENFDNLWRCHLDGLIVSGTEPRAATLAAEPYWRSLTKLIDWAQEHTISTVWSCLAAHAAVYHLDGIDRKKFPEKLSGVFDCARVGTHRILTATPAGWCIPHSRSNDLPEAALVAAGYQILSRSPIAGADMFMKQGKSLFLFLQGHPEYDQGSLLREYHRDVGRFLCGERDTYPQMPRDYFAMDSAAALDAFRIRALAQRSTELLGDFPSVDVEGATRRHWRVTAVRIYANWLSLLLKSRLTAQVSSA